MGAVHRDLLAAGQSVRHHVVGPEDAVGRRRTEEDVHPQPAGPGVRADQAPTFPALP